MTVVVRGFGLNIDSTSSVVAFGMTREVANVVNPIPEMQAATISECFAIDFGQRRRRRKMTPAEFRRWHAMLKIARRSNRFEVERDRQLRQLNVSFSKMLKLG